MVAVEPSVANCELLKLNLSGCGDFEVIEAGLWGNSPTHPQFWKRDDHQPEPHGVGSLRWDRGIPVVVRSLDSILVELGKVDLMKIDTEGAEFDILGDSKQLHRVDSIFGEYHLWRYTLPVLIASLEANGFAVRSTLFQDDIKVGCFWATKS